MVRKIEVAYASGSEFKKEEVKELLRVHTVVDARNRVVRISDAFEFSLQRAVLEEPLKRELIEVVEYKARSAYRALMVPCIVEHAGLIFEDYETESYPGGLTQPMWDALGAAEFIRETRAAGRRAIARAVVGYCDGLAVHTFVGETRGSIADTPSGSRPFYWDPIFRPDGGSGLTYAEISGKSGLGIAKKVELSQSTKAMKAFLKFRLASPAPMLFK